MNALAYVNRNTEWLIQKFMSVKEHGCICIIGMNTIFWRSAPHWSYMCMFMRTEYANRVDSSKAALVSAFSSGSDFKLSKKLRYMYD